MADIKYEIIDKIAEISDVDKSGWIKEVNIMTWGNSKKPVIDIRKWKRDTDDGSVVMSKGIALNLEEFKNLKNIEISTIERYFNEE